MEEKKFIFTPGVWLGEGKISFRASPEFLKFYTKWEIQEESSGVIKARQLVEIQEGGEHMINVFTFKDIQPTSFTVILENNIVQSVRGKGLRDKHLIAWEFKGELAFEGFEVYEQQENGDYFLHAEYGLPDEFSTIVEGLIWWKESSS